MVELEWTPKPLSYVLPFMVSLPPSPALFSPTLMSRSIGPQPLSAAVHG